ncbi:outer membrane receptor protein involved in Fe transport [Flavobacteriaceae bacterium MAR_2010_105]|nr:outer membrane receptor protein involved in Fe transport [Flavobacteriaceae bacterium MAR_2010_105]
MKKLFFLCILFSLYTFNTQATTYNDEREGTISGQVIDINLNTPLPYVNVVIKNEAGDIVTGGITDDEGQFKIGDIPDGKVLVNIQYIGYKTVIKEVTIGRGNYKVELGAIPLEEEAAGLDEVTVVAEVSTIQQKVDRKVITIGKDLAASGTASDIMVGIPSVSVDAQSGDISLRGNQNVRVMVDGKISNIPTAQLLKQIPSTAIKSIELITNPSAKHNPEGMSGIINIVLHKNTMIGFNGNVSVGLSHERNPKFNSSINTNYRNGKFNFYANYSNNISKSRNVGNVFRPDDNSEQFFRFLDKRQSHLYKVGVDFYLNEKNTFSLFTTQNASDSSNEGQTLALFYNNPSADQSQLLLAQSDNLSSQYNFDYKLLFDKEGHNIELEVDYNRFDDTTPVDYIFLLGSNQDYKDRNFTDRTSSSVNLDYVNPLSENVKLEFGLEARLFNSDINFSSTGETYNSEGNLRPTPDTNFDYTRDIYSAYGTYSKKFEKWTMQIGVRLENVNEDAFALETEIGSNETNVIEFTNDYFQVYPSAFFTYSPSEKNSYQLSYSRRVDRPGIGQINPIKEWSTPLVSSFGNINLVPQFTNSIEVNYTRQLEKGSVTAGVFYRAISDEINRAIFVDRSDINSGRVIITHDNFDDTSAYGVELSTNYKPTKWWNINSSFDLYSQTQKGIAERLNAPIETATVNDIVTEVREVDNVAWNFRMFNNFSVNKALTLTAFGFYRGQNKSLQFDVEPMYFVNVGARVNFLEGKGTFSFNYNDIFNTMKFQGTGTAPYRQDVEFNWESNTWNIGLSYRFGGGKYRAKSRKDRDDGVKSDGGGFI